MWGRFVINSVITTVGQRRGVFFRLGGDKGCYVGRNNWIKFG